MSESSFEEMMDGMVGVAFTVKTAWQRWRDVHGEI